ncbi:MAG: YgaP family membrane protein [Armatimonadota bacterium]
MIPKTSSRVHEHTAPEINERIQKEIEETVRLYSAAPPQLIERRLEELDREWDIERTLEANAGTISAVTTVLGLLWKRSFLIMPLIVGSFLLQHAVQGWCPPLAIFRRKGVRTRSEIESERQALKALRGDYRDVPPRQECEAAQDVSQYVTAAQR